MSTSGTKSRTQKEKEGSSAILHVPAPAASPSPEKPELSKTSSSKKSSKQAAKSTAPSSPPSAPSSAAATSAPAPASSSKSSSKKDSSEATKRPVDSAAEPPPKPKKKKKADVSDQRTAEERQAELAELAEILPEENIDDGVFLVDYIVAERKNKKGKLEYLIKWKGYSDSQNTWEPAGNILTPQLLEEFEKRKATDPSGVAEAAAGSRSKSKQASMDSETAQKKSKKKKPSTVGTGDRLSAAAGALALDQKDATGENGLEPEPKAESAATPTASEVSLTPSVAEDTAVSTLVDGIQFIESAAVPTSTVSSPLSSSKRSRSARPPARKEFVTPSPSGDSVPPTRARASALTAKLLLSEGLHRDESFEEDIAQKQHAALSAKKRPTHETWSSSHAHILLAPQPPQESGQHIPLSSAATTAAIARRDVNILIEKNADLLRRANFINPPGVEPLEVGVPRTIEDAVRQTQAAPEKDSRPFILDNNGKFTADEWAQLSRVLMDLGFATISDFNSKMILATKPVLQNFQYFKDQFLSVTQPSQAPKPSQAASSSSLHSSATSFSASTSDLLAGSLINLAALQQRVPENTKKN